MLNTSLREHCLQRIRDNRVNGASEIAREALALVAEYAREARAEQPRQLRGELERLAQDLRALRPGMAPINNLLALWQKQIGNLPAGSLEDLRRGAMAAAESWSRRSLQAVDRIAAHAAAMIEPGEVVITHSLSSTVGAVFRRLRGRRISAIVTESSPGREGRLLAAQLSALGISTDFITDAQIGIFCRRASLALVGADSVLADGSVLNKAGTSLLALAARDADRPFYVCAESFKRRDQRPDQLKLDEDPGSLIQAPDLPGVRARNHPLDLTPASAIDAWIDEDGVALVGAGQDDRWSELHQARTPDPVRP